MWSPKSTDVHTPSRTSAMRALILAVFATLALSASAVTDVDILNFALNLECLEAQFYSYAALGVPLNATLTGNGPAPIGGAMASLSGFVKPIANEIAMDEISHVNFLRTALGAKAAVCPQVDIGPAFNTAVRAALGITDKNFDPYKDDTNFLLAAFLFEDVGVTAYKGAAPLIVDKGYLSAAAGILAVEAYHAGIIRTLLYQRAVQYVKPYNIQVALFVEKLSHLRETLDGTGNDDFGVIAPPATDNGFYFPFKSDMDSSLVPTDANAIAFSRTIPQVLSIVYGTPITSNPTKGLFYPNGINPAK
ncbi:hypothetical protein WJX81_004318 [Elliptochloris bilobata]|uniref:Desiccation-related protein PCC13-62 n=1 Tax=Elliptochloris bilobata TaxID=381761 RepID=A0AAW1RU55_9CHLO